MSLHECDRPMIFGNEVISIMVHSDVSKLFCDFFKLSKVHFETFRFQKSFELIRFPNLTKQEVEELLDRLIGTDVYAEA